VENEVYSLWLRLLVAGFRPMHFFSLMRQSQFSCNYLLAVAVAVAKER